MKTQHTPGPWVVANDCRFIVVSERFNRPFPAISACSREEIPFRFLDEARHLTDAEYRESEKEGWAEARQAEQEANARLIAAAPQLLESLQECLAIVRLQNGNLHDDVNAIQERANTAIEKATAVTNIPA